MHSTKTEILALLKRTDGCTVDELSSALGLAQMTVRQHLTALERDDLVRAQARRTTGRPHYVYRLTDEGHRRLGQGYDRMLALLVEEAGHLEAADLAGATPDERRRRLFAMAAARLAERHRPEVLALAGRERVERIVAVLRSHGGFAEWHEAGEDAYELRDFGCVCRMTAGGGGDCDWHEGFLRGLLGDGVRVADGAMDCAACCRYLIGERMAAPANRG